MKGEGLITIPDLVLFYSTLLLAKAQWQIIEIAVVLQGGCGQSGVEFGLRRLRGSPQP